MKALENQNEELHAENISINKINEALVTKGMERVPTPRGGTKKEKLIRNLPRLYQGFATDLEKTKFTWVPKEVCELKRKLT